MCTVYSFNSFVVCSYSQLTKYFKSFMNYTIQAISCQLFLLNFQNDSPVLSHGEREDVEPCLAVNGN